MGRVYTICALYCGVFLLSGGCTPAAAPLPAAPLAPTTDSPTIGVDAPAPENATGPTSDTGDAGKSPTGPSETGSNQDDAANPPDDQEKGDDAKGDDAPGTPAEAGTGDEPKLEQPEKPTPDKTGDDNTSPEDDPRRSGRLFRGGKPGDLVDISFDDLNLGMQPDVVFRPFMLTDRAKELEGKRVRISGFILASDRVKGMKEFVLLRNTECKFGAGGQADHLLRILMKDGETAAYQTKPISIEGVLKLNPFPDPRQTWSVFDLEGATKIRNARR